jgi:hypothetical protein
MRAASNTVFLGACLLLAVVLVVNLIARFA